MNRALDKAHVIDRSRLHSGLYFESLLEEAHSKKLLSDKDIERMQFECLSLLAHKTESCNSGASSSIRVEKAQEIMKSILFTIGVALKTYPNPDDAVNVLQQKSINELYQIGRRLIDDMISSTKAIHLKLIDQLVDTGNSFYSSTLVDGILGFFKLYAADYAAHEIHITVDYPLFNPISELYGIEYIKAYVTAASLENKFCSYFAGQDIHHLLTAYAEDYQDIPMNIYEQVLTAAIGCAISAVDCSRLDVTQAGVQHLLQVFAEQSKGEILTTITKAAGKLTRLFQFSQELTAYIQNSLPLVASNIYIAAENHTLNRTFYVADFTVDRPKIIFSYGDKMDDRKYRKAISEITECRYLQDKLAIIKEHIHSLADMEDVLLDAELTGEEIGEVLLELSLTEIAVLNKKYSSMTEKNAFDLREPEKTLCASLQDFVSTLPPQQQAVIAQLIKALQ